MSRNSRYTDKQIIDAVKDSSSVMEVMRKIDMKLAGGSHQHLKKRINNLGLDISHFTGQAHNKGKVANNKLVSKDILVYDRFNGRKEHSYKLRRALLENNVKYMCAICGLPGMWNNKELILQIHHIDNNPLNNIQENLIFICPNCHTQTTHFSRRK